MSELFVSTIFFYLQEVVEMRTELSGLWRR